MRSTVGLENAHIGKDSEGARGVGTHFLPGSTKEMGRKLLRWVGEAAHDMVLIDSFRLARRRGTFIILNGTQKDWNELDVASVSEKASCMINSVRTIGHGLGVTTGRKSMASIWQKDARNRGENLRRRQENSRSNRLQYQECEASRKKQLRRVKKSLRK